eukprot:4501963-Pyramimonas_sp.AAC.1
MEIATKVGCRFWLGAQGAIMTENVVPAAAVIAIRLLQPRHEHGRQIWPDGPAWDCPPLAARQPLSKCGICAVLPGQEIIDDPPGIAPTDLEQDMDQQPKTPYASSSSAQRPIAPQLGATPAGRASDADALDETM